jgi:3-phosphoglycerate kinase
MKFLKDSQFNQKTVLVRCDFNVSINENGTIIDDFRIDSSIETIKHLLKDGAKVVLITHLSDEEKVLLLIHSKLEEKIKQKIFLIKDGTNSKTQSEVKKSSFGSVFLLDNIRKYKEEIDNDEVFARNLSMLGNTYVNEAFSVCHRNHASISGLPQFIPSYAGYQLLKEVKILSKARTDPWKPLVVIIGGAKVESKIKTLNSFMKMADHIALGGKLVNEILTIKGIVPGRTSISSELAQKINQVELTSSKLHLPVDVLVSSNPKGDFYVRVTGPGLIRKDEDIYDIGPETIKIYSEIIKTAKMIIWAGPLGLYEEKKFRKGTEEIARAIAMNHDAFRIVGGGDTGAFLSDFKIKGAIEHLSTGGGAMLNFLAGEELPGLKALGY